MRFFAGQQNNLGWTLSELCCFNLCLTPNRPTQWIFSSSVATAWIFVERFRLWTSAYELWTQLLSLTDNSIDEMAWCSCRKTSLPHMWQLFYFCLLVLEGLVDRIATIVALSICLCQCVALAALYMVCSWGRIPHWPPHRFVQRSQGKCTPLLCLRTVSHACLIWSKSSANGAK